MNVSVAHGRVFVILFLLVLMLAGRALAKCESSPSERIFLECQQELCKGGFKVILSWAAYCVVAPVQIVSLNSDELAGVHSHLKSEGFFESLSPQGNNTHSKLSVTPRVVEIDHYGGVGEEYEVVAPDSGFRSLQDASNFWQSRIFYAYMVKWSLFFLDIAVLSVCLAVLFRSAVTFKKRYLDQDYSVRFFWFLPVIIWLVTFINLLGLYGESPLYFSYLLFLIVPLIWTGEVFALGFYALRRRYNQQKSGSPPARG
jgi:hypothetical protein